MVLLNDFKDGGFPLCRRAPILCITPVGPQIVYNRYTLAHIAAQQEILYCIGVWPGKKSTDAFIINPEAYIKCLPPEEHADIDSALEILLKGDSVAYIPGPHQNPVPVMVSDSPDLVKYIKTAGLKHRYLNDLSI